MTPVVEQLLPIIFIATCLIFAALVLWRTKQATTMGARSEPLSRDDRLHLSLALSALEEASRELSHAAWKGYVPGHPQVGQLLLDVKDAIHRADALLREEQS